MRLLELNPRWFGLQRVRTGLTFLCPCCMQERLGVFFTPYINLSGIEILDFKDQLHWNRTGDSFDTLSLSPSIDASHLKHRHGFITEGRIT